MGASTSRMPRTAMRRTRKSDMVSVWSLVGDDGVNIAGVFEEFHQSRGGGTKRGSIPPPLPPTEEEEEGTTLGEPALRAIPSVPSDETNGGTVQRCRIVAMTCGRSFGRVVQSTVEQLILGGHTQAYRTQLRFTIALAKARELPCSQAASLREALQSNGAPLASLSLLTGHWLLSAPQQVGTNVRAVACERSRHRPSPGAV